MTKFVNSVFPMKDEAYLSVLRRTCLENGLTDFMTIADRFLGISCRRNRIALNETSGIGEFVQSIADVTDPALFFAEHTLYAAAVPFLSRAYQMNHVNACFRKKYYPSLIAATDPLSRTIRFCRECIKEDLAAVGTAVIHRQHMLPGIRVCPKHGCPLTEYKGSPSEFFSGTIDLGFDYAYISDADFRYASFAEGLLEVKIPTDISGSYKAMSARAKDLGFSEKHPEILTEAIQDDGLLPYFKETPRRSLSQASFSQRRFTSDSLAMAAFLFKDAQTFMKYIPPDHETYEEFTSVKGNDYWILKTVSENIVSMKHLVCDTDFVTTPYGFVCGWRCPECDRKSDDEKFREIVRLSAGPEYEPTDHFESLNSAINIRHACGKTLKCTPMRFIYREVRCGCERKWTAEKTIRKIEAMGDYKVISCTGESSPVTIRHLTCGSEFSFQSCFYCLKKEILCPKCEEEAKRAEMGRRFEDKVRSLVGEEYTVTGKYRASNAYVKIRHNVCGKEQSYVPSAFLRGVRCPICTIRTAESEFIEAVSSVSLGRYEVISITADGIRCVLRDVSTGKIITGEKRRIIQELNRPTMSDIIPMDMKKPSSIGSKHMRYIERPVWKGEKPS